MGNGTIDTWIIILILLLFGLLEFLASFSFNIKIKMINKKKYTNAAALGAFSTMLFMMLSLTAPLIATGIDAWWFILLGAFMMAVGNMAAMLVIRPFESWWSKKFPEKEVQ